MTGGSTMGGELNTVLTTAIEPSTIVEQFIGFLPWIGMMVGAAFAINLVRKMIKGAAKGKVRV